MEPVNDPIIEALTAAGKVISSFRNLCGPPCHQIREAIMSHIKANPTFLLEVPQEGKENPMAQMNLEILIIREVFSAAELFNLIPTLFAPLPLVPEAPMLMGLYRDQPRYKFTRAYKQLMTCTERRGVSMCMGLVMEQGVDALLALEGPYLLADVRGGCCECWSDMIKWMFCGMS